MIQQFTNKGLFTMIKQTNKDYNAKRIMFILMCLFPSIMGYTQDAIQVHNNAILRSHSGSQIGVFGTLINNGSLGDSVNSNQGKLYLIGSDQQYIMGGSSIQFDSVILNNSNNVIVDLEFRISKNLQFVNGTFSTNRSDSDEVFIHFLDNANYAGQSDSAFVDGTVRKTGNDAFVFPLGQYYNLQTLAISSPAQITDHFTVFYKQQDPTNSGYSTQEIDSNCGGSPVLVDISELEYWNLERTGGASSIEITLNYDQYSGVNTPSELMLARWNGTKWESKGNGGITGSATEGTIVSGNGCGSVGTANVVSVFGPFTLSASSLTALPVEYLFFQAAKYDETQALLEWATASETNNSYFAIERSSDGYYFENIGEINGAGNSNNILQYEFIDRAPNNGINYYRIKQVDFNGEFNYTKIEPLYFEPSIGMIAVYPVPAHSYLNIDFSGIVNQEENYRSIRVFDSYGKLVQEEKMDSNNAIQTINILDWSCGIYTLQINKQSIKVIKF